MKQALAVVKHGGNQKISTGECRQVDHPLQFLCHAGQEHEAGHDISCTADKYYLLMMVMVFFLQQRLQTFRPMIHCPKSGPSDPYQTSTATMNLNHELW